jgi:hypothetical protein
MDTVPALASVSEAMDMVQAGLSYLAAAVTGAVNAAALETSDAI